MKIYFLDELIVYIFKKGLQSPGRLVIHTNKYECMQVHTSNEMTSILGEKKKFKKNENNVPNIYAANTPPNINEGGLHPSPCKTSCFSRKEK